MLARLRSALYRRRAYCATALLAALVPGAGRLPAATADEPPDGADAPSAELLEFLGQWQTGDGGWIDPTLWPAEPQQTAAEQQR